MSEKNPYFGKFKEIIISQPEDIKLLQFIFIKYLKDQGAIDKLVAEAEKEGQDDMALMLLESLKLAEKDKGVEEDLVTFITRNDMLDSVVRWLGLGSKEQLLDEYNLQASSIGIKSGLKEKNTPSKNTGKN